MERVVALRRGEKLEHADSLFARSQLAIEESRQLRLQSRALHDEQNLRREGLRLSVFESAMQRSELKAYRDNENE
jgi:hypothetical protein